VPTRLTWVITSTSLAVLHGTPIPCLSKAQQNVEGKNEFSKSD
jgi:hypothetical protein